MLPRSQRRVEALAIVPELSGILFSSSTRTSATGAVAGGTFTLTAANGDNVFGTFGGQSLRTDTPNVVTYEDPA